VKREFLVGTAIQQKGTALLKVKWLRTEIIRADVLSEAEETRAEETATFCPFCAFCEPTL